jgi:hypothetical protein
VRQIQSLVVLAKLLLVSIPLLPQMMLPLVPLVPLEVL